MLQFAVVSISLLLYFVMFIYSIKTLHPEKQLIFTKEKIYKKIKNFIFIHYLQRFWIWLEKITKLFL